MKTRATLRILALLTLATSLLAGPRDAQWKKVEEAQKKGLPKTAIEALEPIITDSLAEKSYAEAIKAIGRKIALEGNIQGNKPEEKIVRLEAVLATSPAAMKPMLEAILANWYWHYLQQSSQRFFERTQTAKVPGTDIQTWDFARIVQEIDRHYTAALADTKSLQATPVSDYNELLQMGSVPDKYRPTLFDFLAYEALHFYQTGKHAATKAENEFELDADSQIFADAAEFLKWQPDRPSPAPEKSVDGTKPRRGDVSVAVNGGTATETSPLQGISTFTTTDETSPSLKAIRLYQSLLKFHQADADRSAFYDADLSRLTFGHNRAVGENKPDRYKAALQRFIDATAKHEISARALALLATQIDTEGEPAQAHVLAQRGLDAFPQSKGGALCLTIIQQIEAKSARLSTEAVWNAPWPTLDVAYRNVTHVYFRAVTADFEESIKQPHSNFGYVNNQQLEKLLASTPALTWQADLPPTNDYRERTEKLPAPTSLPAGFYFILASHDPAFGTADNQLTVTPVWVSDLALVIQQRNDGQPDRGFVLQAGSGEPVSGAGIQFWRQGDDGRFEALAPTQTDKDGRFEIARLDRPYVLLASHEGKTVANTRGLWSQQRRAIDPDSNQTVFFTDRAIYRPGQAINYKGIAIHANTRSASYETIRNKTIVVRFRDPNGKEIARTTHTTNDYGSFGGTFTAPRDRVMGAMSLIVEGVGGGQAYFNVEEYKRPKFQVEFAAPVEAAKLDAPVALTGRATAYTGAAIGGAKVKWRVERSVRFPSWCWWWQPPAVKAIAHGTTTTELDGTYKIQFTAAPDRAVPSENEPVFNFNIHADVTDTTGETHSVTRTVRAGYTALAATLSSDDWQTRDKPVEFSISTRSLDGEPQAARGTLTIRALKQPDTVARASLTDRDDWRWPIRGTAAPKVDPSNPDSWESGQVVAEHPFKTDATGQVQLAVPLPTGIYRGSLETKDRFGKIVTARRTVQVVDPAAEHYGVKQPNFFSSPKWSVEPGEKFTALWGTGYDAGRAFVEIERDGKPLKSYWTDADRTQSLVELPITEEMRGGLSLRVTFLRENRAYFNQKIIQVPWTNKELTLKWESFRSKLLPGQKETWTALVTGPDAKRAAAEMVATLYDASLDQFKLNRWTQKFGVFRQENVPVSAGFQNATVHLLNVAGRWKTDSRRVDWRYRSFPSDINANFSGSGYLDEDRVVLSAFAAQAGGVIRGYAIKNAMVAGSIEGEIMNAPNFVDLVPPSARGGVPPAPTGAPTELSRSLDLSKVTARKNLNETAFFFPHLLADEDGVVKIQFTMPEALTEWKFLGFAHDQNLRAGFLTAKVVTAKDLMVEPNPPRFVREGDAIEFTVKVSNQSDQPQAGKVKLTFADAATLQSVDAALGNRATEQAFAVPARQSRSYSWRIAVPDGLGFLTYKAVGATAQASDGEEGFLPVLSRRILVTESLPLPIRGQTTKQFEFKKLLDSGKSDTLRHEALTVQMVSQPAWYAVMALPYLMEFPYECSEQLFNRLYANTLARHIANSDPKIRRVFDLWKNTPAVDSPLAKNQDLKSVMLEETPWLRQANNESQSRRNVGLLFDANRLDEETARTLGQLAERQLSDGLWSWFPGGRRSEYISLYITTGFGRLRHLGAEVDVTPAIKALGALDAWMEQHYRDIQRRPNPGDYVPSHLEAIYLYSRSFFLADRPVAKENQPAVDFFLGQSRKFWLRTDCRMCQAQLALALQRFGDKDTPLAIMQSIKERSVSDEELGVYWRDLELNWWWYRAPIETQAMMIEAFSEVTHDAAAVEACKVWLLKQKQTQDWKTTKATADAIYGLLLKGDGLLSSDALVEVAFGGETIKPEKVEAGTGFYEQKFVRSEIKPAMGAITVKKVDDGVSWGSVHWQYLEDMSKVTPHEGTPLKLKKALFLKETTTKGQVLKPVTGSLAVGDELVVRIELRTDRDMEYVHLKDQRGSGTEPVNVLSRYKYQDGLAYYESTRDTASHFFIDYLPKGTYVFEYSTRVQLKGSYQTGIAEIQCMYAPDFNSHSESFTLEVK